MSKISSCNYHGNIFKLVFFNSQCVNAYTCWRGKWVICSIKLMRIINRWRHTAAAACLSDSTRKDVIRRVNVMSIFSSCLLQVPEPRPLLWRRGHSVITLPSSDLHDNTTGRLCIIYLCWHWLFWRSIATSSIRPLIVMDMYLQRLIQPAYQIWSFYLHPLRI